MRSSTLTPPERGVERTCRAAEEVPMAVVIGLLGVVGVGLLALAAARWASGHGSTAVRREAERGVQELERFLSEVR